MKKPNGYWYIKENVLRTARKCKTRLEFHERYKHVYPIAKEQGWLDDCYKHMGKKETDKIRRWTKKSVLAAARKCKTRTAFCKRFGGAYNVACRKGYFEECVKHMTGLKRWNKKKALAAARKCKTREEFRRTCGGALTAAYNGGYLDECLAHMIKTRKPANYWTKKRILEAARKCKTRAVFMRKHSTAYGVANRDGYLQDCFKHMGKKKTGTTTIVWTKKKIREAAGKCKSRAEFTKRYNGAYCSALKSGYLDKCCKHMIKKGNRFKKAIYAIVFSNKSVYVGLTFDYEARLAAHIADQRNKNVKALLEKNCPYRVWKFNKWFGNQTIGKEEQRVIDAYRKRGFTILNINKAGALGGRGYTRG